jgi:hypothetical protein
MEYDAEKVVQLYRKSPAQLYQCLKPGDTIVSDADSILEVEKLLNFCRISYDKNIDNSNDKAQLKITIH